MASFFEKLKKGMNVEVPAEETEDSLKEPRMEVKELGEEPKEKKPRFKNPKVKKEEKTDFKKVLIEDETPEEAFPAQTEETKQEEKKKALKAKDWLGEEEGELAIDIYQTKDELVIQTAIAGITIEKLNIFLEKDILTIKGLREKPLEEKGDYFFQECFWGPFSREVILPVEVDPDRVSAKLKSGILTIRIPKIIREKKRKIAVSI